MTSTAAYRAAQARRLRRYFQSLGIKGTDPYPWDLDISPICDDGNPPQIVPEDIDFIAQGDATDRRIQAAAQRSAATSLPLTPPADGGAWRWKDPRGRGGVTVPAHPACIYDMTPPGAPYRPCGQPGQRYPCGYRCPSHAPDVPDNRRRTSHAKP